MKFFLGLFLLFAQSVPAQDLESTVRRGLATISTPAPDFVVCDEGPVPNSLSDVNSIRTTEQRGCDPLLPGRHRVMSRTRYQSGNYVMRNLGNGRYAAVLNLDFVAGRGASPELVESMKARTMNCIRSLNPYLRNGNESLEIQITSPRDRLENIPRPRENVITVTNEASDFRGDAGHYGSNFTCRTIGHELLHLLGLCDEYHEGIKPAAPPAANARGRAAEMNYMDWSCRPVTTSVSYMRNTWAFNEILPQTRRCDCNDEWQQLMRAPQDIRNMFLSMNGEELMNSEMSLIDNPITQLSEARAPIRSFPFCTSATGSLDTGVRPPVMKSFLYEGNSAGVHSFASYRPRYTPPVNGSEGFYWYGYQRYTCDCRRDTSNYCNRLVQALAVRARETIPTVQCPQTVSSPRDIQSSVARPDEVMRPSELDTSVNPPQLVLRTPGNGQSLLRPQHFERIKAGDCRNGAASNYEFCEQYAYMGRNPIQGDGYNMTTIPPNPAINQCADVPAQCFDDSFYLDGVGSPPASPRRGTRRE